MHNVDVETVLFLIGVSADVNSRIQDSSYRTPLHLAVNAGSEIIVRHLVSPLWKGFIFVWRIVLVTVAFVYAKSRWCSNLNSRTNYIKLWIERASTHLTFVCHISSKLLAGSRFNEVDKHHQTALHLAAANNSASILSILLENGAEPDAADDKGNNGKQWLLFLKFIVSMAIRIVYFFFAETVSRHKTSFSWGVMKGC